jgi:hypothetical protein
MQTRNRYFRGELVVGIGLIITVLLLAACGVTGTTTSGGPAASSTSTGTVGSFRVTSVTMAVTPASLAGLACGTNVTVTYTATIHVASGGSGGTVQFSYTVDNGRGETPASITLSPGETSKTYAFTWSGALPADHTAPGPGGIQVTSPNQLTSPLIAPTGMCGQTSAKTWTTIQSFVAGGNYKSASFQVTSPWRLLWQCNLSMSNLSSFPLKVDVLPNTGPGGALGVINTVCKDGNTSGTSAEESTPTGLGYLSVSSPATSEWDVMVQVLR